MFGKIDLKSFLDAKILLSNNDDTSLSESMEDFIKKEDKRKSEKDKEREIIVSYLSKIQ